MEYPELSSRPEVGIGVDSSGYIWAAIGYNMTSKQKGNERLFGSRDGGITWTAKIIKLADGVRFIKAFTILRDNGLLLLLGSDDASMLGVYLSDDYGETWNCISTITSCPFEAIGEGYLYFTELKDGTILLPVARWNKHKELSDFPHYVFFSKDRGRTWQASMGNEDGNFTCEGAGSESKYPGTGGTFPGCCEAHIIELEHDSLLAAFRYSGAQLPWHRDKIDEWGGIREWAGKPVGTGRIFKNLMLGNSSDGGRTWSNLRPVADETGHPLLEFGECHGHMLRMPDGRIILVHDHRYPYERGETIARISEDGGKTWLADTYHLSYGSCYPASVVLGDGTIVTIITSTRYDSRSVPIEPWNIKTIRWRLPGN